MCDRSLVRGYVTSCSYLSCVLVWLVAVINMPLLFLSLKFTFPLPGTGSLILSLTHSFGAVSLSFTSSSHMHLIKPLYGFPPVLSATTSTEVTRDLMILIALRRSTLLTSALRAIMRRQLTASRRVEPLHRDELLIHLQGMTQS